MTYSATRGSGAATSANYCERHVPNGSEPHQAAVCGETPQAQLMYYIFGEGFSYAQQPIGQGAHASAVESSVIAQIDEIEWEGRWTSQTSC